MRSLRQPLRAGILRRTASAESHTFDSFECAIEALAPRCAHCNCRVIGHGVEKSGKVFCCDHCARQ
jgi:hypothetical protein